MSRLWRSFQGRRSMGDRQCSPRARNGEAGPACNSNPPERWPYLVLSAVWASPPVRAHLWFGRYGPCAEGPRASVREFRLKSLSAIFFALLSRKEKPARILGRQWMRSDLAKIAPAANARGKDLGPCGDEVSGHGGARQHGGLRADGCGVRPASLQYGARTAMRRLASRLSLTVRGGGWLVYTQSQRRGQ